MGMSGALCLMLSVLLQDSAAADRDPSTRPLHQGTLVSSDVVDELPDGSPVQLHDTPFMVGIINNGAAFDRFAKHARSMDGLLAAGPIDWSEEAVVYVILRLHTHHLSLDSIASGVDGQSRVTLTFHSTEPDWGDRYYTLLCRIPAERLTAVDVQVRFEGGFDSDNRTWESIGLIEIPGL